MEGRKFMNLKEKLLVAVATAFLVLKSKRRNARRKLGYPEEM